MFILTLPKLAFPAKFLEKLKAGLEESSNVKWLCLDETCVTGVWLACTVGEFTTLLGFGVVLLSALSIEDKMVSLDKILLRILRAADDIFLKML